MKFSPAITNLSLSLMLALALCSAPSSHALVVDELYFQELPVQGQGDAERLRAYREALTAVILKVTGEERWLRDGSVERAVRDAQSFVQEVSYRSSGGGALSQTFIRIRFDQELVDNMLGTAGIPVWDRNRPSILLWLTVQGPDGQREVLGSDSEHPALELIREFSRVRGVPILIPVMDFEDRRSLPADVAWSLDEAAIRQASARYGADSILSGRVLSSPGGDLVGLWQFLFRDRVETFDSLETDLAAYMQSALTRVTAQLATHFAINVAAQPVPEQVTLRVEGVDDITAYVNLLSYIGSLAVVDNMSTSLLDGSNIELSVSLSGSTYLFTEFLTLGRDLVPGEPTVPQEAQGNVLHYRWVR
ncbi:MAG: hypothetical protein A3H44_08055 [Gammaproteobacteria bacterium RIFCSPLOWO2_02_FULL_57_10]|nr:MAG: hypothetical protein A3H44_08055 [Gammaproteobacteria bacterium RIFCSPLOWO2_02_FULL_57_10]